MKLCKSLRWKAGYGRTWASREELVASLTIDEVQYSCLSTCQPWGPDDGPAAPAQCQPHRPCFKLSKRDPDAFRIAAGLPLDENV